MAMTKEELRAELVLTRDLDTDIGRYADAVRYAAHRALERDYREVLREVKWSAGGLVVTVAHGESSGSVAIGDVELGEEAATLTVSIGGGCIVSATQVAESLAAIVAAVFDAVETARKDIEEEGEREAEAEAAASESRRRGYISGEMAALRGIAW